MTKQTYHNKEVGKNAFTDEEKRNFKELLLPQFPDITIDDIFFLKQKYAKVNKKAQQSPKLISL